MVIMGLASYNLVPILCDEILLSNGLNNIAKYSKDEQSLEFEGVCIAFKASLDGWLVGCRPIIGLDGCFLKGKYGGQVLSMIGLDGNNGLFPIAIYICRSEGKETWNKFLGLMAKYLEHHCRPLTFMSDRQKGLIQAVKETFPRAAHRFCFRHMYKNFKKFFTGAYMELLAWSAAKAYKKFEFERIMKLIEVHDSAAVTWLNRDGYESWSRAHYDHETKCDQVTNNFSESFNNWILYLRDLPIASLVDKYHLMVMSLRYKRKEAALQQMKIEGLVPIVEKYIKKMIEFLPSYMVDGSDANLFVVRNEHGTRWTVNLVDHACDCQKWQLTGIVCVHAIAVLYPRRMSWTEYCSSYYHARTYLLAYSGNIKPMRDMQEWEKPTDPEKKVLPPPFERGIGRPRKQRIRDEGEKEDRGRINSKRRRMTCTRCQKTGHNSRTCKGLPAADNGRKKKAKGQGKNTTTTESVDSGSQNSAPPNTSSQNSAFQNNIYGRRPTANIVDEGSTSSGNAPTNTRSKNLYAKETSSSKAKAKGTTNIRSKNLNTKEASSSKDKAKGPTSQGKKPSNQPETLVYYPPNDAYLKGTKATEPPERLFFQGPEQRHSMSDLIAKQKTKSIAEVLASARVTFGTPGATPSHIKTPTPFPWPVTTKQSLPPLAPRMNADSRSKSKVVRPPQANK